MKEKLKFSRETLVELTLFFLFILASFLLRETPPKPSEKKLNLQSQVELKEKEPSQRNAIFETKGNITGKTPEKASLNYAYLFKRNPFTLEGSYSPTPIPENPFTLIAIRLSPSSKTAILKSFTGEFLTVKEGDKLLDGSKVVEISENKVVLERLGKKKELKIFSVEVEKWKPKRPF